MKSISCKELGMSDDFVATGETNDEVKRKLNEHLLKAHRDKAMGMTDEDKKNMEKTWDDMLAKQK